MNPIIPNEGELEFLKSLLQNNDMTFHLFVNDYTPVGDSVVADLTEMSTLGYASKSISRNDWTFSTNAEGKGTATNVLKIWNSFTEGTPVTVYGVFIKFGTKLIGVERFANPVVIGTAGEVGKIEGIPYFGAQSENT